MDILLKLCFVKFDLEKKQWIFDCFWLGDFLVSECFLFNFEIFGFWRSRNLRTIR